MRLLALYTTMDTEDHFSTSDFSLSSSHPSLSHKHKAGRSKFKEIRPPVYWGGRGYNGRKRVCEVPNPNKKSRLWLGTFANPEMTADAAIAPNSISPPLNFPESACALPCPGSISLMDIRNATAGTDEMYQEPPEHRMGTKPKIVFVDEKEMFNMPELMNEMAAGMLVTPLAMQRGFDWDGVESHMDLSLWRD